MNAADIENILRKARETYGNKNQILVCIEELNELACVLAKYPRYENEEEATQKLKDSVLDEVADVLIILDHIQNILGLKDEEIGTRIELKVERLERWLRKSDSMQQTLEDRKVGAAEEGEDLISCKTCGQKDYNLCKTCMSTEGAEGIKPYYKPQNE